MSSTITPAQPSRCRSSGVSTFIPEMDMSTTWCGTPEKGKLTSMVLQDCCTSDVQSIGGCTLCHTEDKDAEDSTAFLQSFSHCLKKGLGRHNGSTQFASYCNTPKLSSAASLHQSWGGLGVGCTCRHIICIGSFSLALSHSDLNSFTKNGVYSREILVIYLQ
jgi:hypothetical protein